MSGALANAGRAYQAAVIGAGPAGLALVATLLDAGTAPILWVDPAFTGGRLERYVEVPSNTKVKLFTHFATVSPALAAISAAAIEPLKNLDPDKGCSLRHAQHMVRELASAIRSQYKDKVHCQQGTVSSLVQQGDGSWQVDSYGSSPAVYLATGARPRSSLPGSAAAVPSGSTAPRVLELDDMLSPSRLAKLVQPSDVVGVVGSSHSAVLVLHNLLDAPQPPKKVINLYRSPLLYAKFMDNWILYDNTGLKGFAADWAKEKLETRVYEEAGRLERVCVKDDPSATPAALARCSAVVYAVGFNANPTPKIVPRSSGGEALRKIDYDNKTGRIVGADGVRGFGIAFPEQVTDPHGNVELAVGMWKFMRYVRDVLLPSPKHATAPQQQQGTRAA